MMMNKLYALGFTFLLGAAQISGAEITRDQLDALKNDSGLKGVVVRYLDTLTELGKQESKVRMFSPEYENISHQKDVVQRGIWDACLHFPSSAQDFSEVGIEECSASRFLLNLKIKSGYRVEEKTIELSKD